ncbi:MAG: 4Fe-4S binding protein, partial [Desulfovibrionaceae bacterium]
RGVAVVNEAMCKGCGSCAGHCPSGAAQIRHFSERQIFAELEGVLAEVPPPPPPEPASEPASGPETESDVVPEVQPQPAPAAP